MKICFISGAFPPMPCGIGDYTCMVAKSLSKMGHEVSVITSKKANNTFTDITVYNIVEKFTRSYINDIIDMLKQIKPDIIHIQYPSNEFYNILVTGVMLPLKVKYHIKGAKLVNTTHELIREKKKDKYGNLLSYAMMDSNIFVEQYYKEIIKEDAKLLYKKLNINYIPITSNIPKSELNYEQKEELKNKIGLSDTKIISYFGFASKKKGIEDLIKAFAMLKEENVRLMYIGELNKKDEYQKSLLDLIHELNLEKKVFITGYIEKSTDVADYLAISDICVFPFKDGVTSRNGSFLAACNQDIKIITTSDKEYDDNKNDIFYITPGNPKKLRLKIEEILKQSKSKIIRKLMDWDEIAEEYISIYNKIIKKKKL